MSTPMSAAPAGVITSSTRLPSLDGLRGVAIALVLMHNLDLLDVTASLPGHVLDLAFDIGWIGVQLFFVLSGFLITGILLDTRRSANYFRSFFGRRVLRIFPLYYATLAVVFVLLPVAGAVPPIFKHDMEHQVWFWLYLSNWRTDVWEAFPQYWSLAVEEQFYLLWPLLVRWCPPRRLLKICIGLAVVSFSVRLGMRLSNASVTLVYQSSLCRMDALALGAAAAVLVREPAWFAFLRERSIAVLLAATAVALPAAAISHGFQRTSFYGQTVGYSGLSIAFALVVLAAALADQRQLATGWEAVLSSRPLRTLGKYSYAMYVLYRPLHKLVGEPIVHALPMDISSSPALAFGYMLAVSSLTLAAAMLSYRFFEMPFLRLKERFAAEPPPAEASRTAQAAP